MWEAPFLWATHIVHMIFPHWAGLQPPNAAAPGLVVAGVALISMVGISCLAFVKFARFPAICLGWLWFAATVVPAVGFAQLATPGAGHGYAYIPMVGLLVAIVCVLPNAVPSKIMRAVGLPVLLLANVLIFAKMTIGDTAAYNERWASIISDVADADRPGARNGFDECQSSCPEIKWLEGVTAMDLALQTVNDDASIHRKIGAALESMKCPQAAAVHYRRAVAIDDSDFDTQYNLGIISLEGDQRADAEQHFWRALEIDPGKVGPYVGIARICDERGEAFEAIKYLECALERDSGELDADVTRIGRILERESLNQAIDRLRPRLELARSSPRVGRHLDTIPASSREGGTPFAQ
jgi:hypothetical protein